MARAEDELISEENATSSSVNIDDSIEDSGSLLKTKKLLQDIRTGAKACGLLVKELDKRSQAAEISGALGLDFLEMKNQLLLDYLIGISGVVLTKSVGKSIVDSPFVDQLVEARTILEKIRPIDQKLKYQVDKLIKTAVEGKVESDPLSFKANPDNLEGRGGDSDEDSDEDEDMKKDSASKSGVYRPPKVAPQHFDDEDNATVKSAEKVKRKSINRALIRELQEEYLETPVEIHNMGDGYDKQLSRETRDKQRFEETYMTRLPITKKDKHQEGLMSTLGVLGDELTDFSRKRGSSSDKSSKSKKRKSGGKSKGGKKRFRK